MNYEPTPPLWRDVFERILFAMLVALIALNCIFWLEIGSYTLK